MDATRCESGVLGVTRGFLSKLRHPSILITRKREIAVVCYRVQVEAQIVVTIYIESQSHIEAVGQWPVLESLPVRRSPLTPHIRICKAVTSSSEAQNW